MSPAMSPPPFGHTQAQAVESEKDDTIASDVALGNYQFRFLSKRQSLYLQEVTKAAAQFVAVFSLAFPNHNYSPA